jgi:hypothetical protein
MRKPISTQMHAVVDLLNVATLATLPKLLNFSPKMTMAFQTLAVGKLVQSLMTDHELGIVRAIPMKAHLAIDAASGASLAALPFVLDEDDPAATASCVALGLFEVMNAPMTQTTPSDRHLPAQAAKTTRRAVGRATRSVRQYVGS